MPPVLKQSADQPSALKNLFESLIRWSNLSRSLQLEWLDQPGHSQATLAANFKDIRRLNRWFAGWSLAERSLRPFLPRTREAVNLDLLDLAAGVSDVPLALARRWRRQGITLCITAVDLDPQITALAKEAAQQEGAACFEAFTANIFQYAWPAGRTYDFVTCSLAFHHFQPQQCVDLLRLMSRLSSRAFLVNDLRRSRWGWLCAWLLTRTIARHPFTRHDGPLSVLRAYTPSEMSALVEQANLGPEQRVEVRRGPFSRLAVIGYHVTEIKQQN